MHYVVEKKKKVHIDTASLLLFEKYRNIKGNRNIVHFLAFSLPTKGAEEQIVTAIAASSQLCVTDVMSL